MTANRIATPLSRKAVLVDVNISAWSARRLDKHITDETNDRYGASMDAGRYNKLLIDQSHLLGIGSLISQARRLHFSMTQPWADEGMRILPNALYQKFSDKFRVIKRDWNTEINKFCREFPSYMEERKRQLNGLFRPEDYPTSNAALKSKYRMDIVIMPFPNAADFRADLDADVMEEIRCEIGASTVRAVDHAKEDTGKRIIDVVGHMAEKLKEYNPDRADGEKRKFFNHHLVENVRELADLLPAFNLTNDPQLDAIIKRIRSELCTEEAADLRKHPSLRASVQKRAEDIVKECERFFA